MIFSHGSLFSGIGGFDLAAEWMGWQNIFHCENNEFAQKILRYYWPQAELFLDIKNANFTKYANKIDILTGGFPCQPYSVAGKRKGTQDERHLWPEMLRAIKEIQPRWVVGENVFGIVNWNGGVVFHEVQTDLEAAGYEVWTYVLPACGVNAPHKRNRVFFIAYATGYECKKQGQTFNKWKINKFQNGYQVRDKFTTNGHKQTTPDTNGNGQHECNSNNEIKSSKGGKYALNDIDKATLHTNSTGKPREHIGQTREGKFDRPDSRDGFNNFQNFPTQPPICSGNDGLSYGLDNITFPKWRNESIKAYGNAIVPQVTYQIFQAIKKYENIK